MVFSNVASTSLTVGFTDNSTTENKFLVQYSTDNVTFTTPTGGSITSTSAATTGTAYSLSLTGLTAATTYYFQVVAIAEVPSGALAGSQATTAAAPRTVNALTYTQNGADTYRGQVNQQVTGLNANTAGTAGSALTLGSLTFDLGSTNPADITNAKLYSTGSSATFATTTLVATTSTIASTYTLTLTTPAALPTGDNYFWLTYDIAAAATPGDQVASVPTAVSVSGTSYTAATTPAITLSGAAASRRIASPLTGTYYVTATAGSSPNPANEFATLTAAATAYNLRGLSAAVSFVLLDATYGPAETFPITFTATSGASASNTLTIRPGAGVSPALAGSVATGAVLKLNGADYVIIDGSNNSTTSQNLTISNTSAAGSGNAVLWLAAASAADGATNNVVRNTNLTGNSSGSPQFTVFVGGGGAGATSPTTSTPASNSNNTLSNNVITKGYYGVFVFGVSATALDQGNTFTGNQLGQPASGTGFGQEGLRLVYQQGASVTGNEIQNISSGTTSSNLYGLYLAESKNSVVSGNSVHGISYSGTSTTKVWAINASTSTFTTAANASANRFVNNLVYGINSTATSATWNTVGLNLGGGYGDQIYYNTVYLSGQLSAAGGTAGSAAFANGNPSVTSVATNLDMRNNIFSIIGGTGGTSSTPLYAHYEQGSTVAGSALNYNDLYVTAGATGQATIGRLNSTDYATLAAWQTATGQEANSVSVNPQFRQTTTVPYSLTPNAPELDGAGLTIAGITTDYAGTTRTSPPDIGALEFTPTDSQPPTITYTALTNTTSTASRTLTATITDPSGIATGAGAPRIYYKLSTASTYYGAVATSTSVNALNNGTYTFTLDYANVGGTPAVGSVIQYYVAAQDASANSNVATSPAGGAGSSPPGSTAPATPNQYSIIAPLPTAISVGTGQAYTSLTNTGGLFEAINNGALAGNTTVTLTSDLTGETGAVALGPLPDGGNNYTLTVQPDGTFRRVTGSATSAAGLIRLAGASRVTFTGQQPAGSQNLLFGNTTANAPTFSFTADAGSNKLTFLNVESANASASSGAIVVGSGITTGSSLNEFSVVDIRSTNNATTATYANGIYSAGLSSTAPNGPNYVYYCPIHNFSGSAVYLAGSNNAGWVLSGNSLFQEAARSAALLPVRIAGGNGHTVSQNKIYQTTGTISAAFTGISLTGGGTGHTLEGNSIGGADGTATGAALTATGVTDGILLAVGTSPATSVQGNVVRALSATGGSLLSGIRVTAGAVNIGTVTGNTIGGAAAGQGLSAYLLGRGISLTSTVACTVSNNQVLGLTTTSSPGLAAYLYGIFISSTGPTTVSGNTVSGVRNTSLVDDTNDNGPLTRGIYSSSTGVLTLTGNQVANIASTATTTGTTTSNSYNYVEVDGIYLYQAGTGSQVLRNRVRDVSSASNGTGNFSDEVYGLLLSASTGLTVANNQLNLPASAAAAPFMGGIFDGTGGNTFAYNSVYLAGSATAASNTYAFARGGTTAIALRNNIFYNARTGTGSHYAIAIGSTTNFTGSTTSPATNSSDYNLFFASDATKMGLYGSTGYSFAGWKTATSGDGSSLSETAAAVPAANLFTSPGTGDLSLQAGSAAAWYANGTGTQLASIGTDYAGASRPTTVAAGAPDIGSAEVTPGSTPPALTATPAAPALGGTQTFSLGGRTLASITYGSTLAARLAGTAGTAATTASALPSLVVGRYYSGTNPPAPFAAGARYANAYFDFQDANADGSGYTYQPTLTYDPALLGTIASETTQRLSQRLADNSGYHTYATTVNPGPARTLAGPGQLTYFSIFGISDQAAPLPAQLVQFEAVHQGADAALSWTTASELANKGFAVQVSTDGQTFRTLGFVAGAGSSASPRRYAFRDQEAGKAGLRYYRLGQTDLSGIVTYSPVRTLAFEVGAGLLAQAAPNPFAGRLALTLSLPAATPASVVLTDALGRPVYARELGSLAAGLSQAELPGLDYLPSGVYLLRVAVAGTTRTLKVVKE